MIVQFRSFVVLLVTVVSVFQCVVLRADKTVDRQKRDLDFIGTSMKEAIETGGTIVNVAQGVFGKRLKPKSIQKGTTIKRIVM